MKVKVLNCASEGGRRLSASSPRPWIYMRAEYQLFKRTGADVVHQTQIPCKDLIWDATTSFTKTKKRTIHLICSIWPADTRGWIFPQIVLHFFQVCFWLSTHQNIELQSANLCCRHWPAEWRRGFIWKITFAFVYRWCHFPACPPPPPTPLKVPFTSPVVFPFPIRILATLHSRSSSIHI